MTGKLTLAGVGPGDPELLTLKAVQAINDADWIAFPQKPGQGSMALDIARPHVPDGKRMLPVAIPMETDPLAAQMAYDQMAEHMIALIAEGDTIVYLCEGDPLFYGSAMYLTERLAGKAEVAVIPGVTSLTAAAAAIPMPLAARNDRLKVLPATLDTETLRSELQNTESVALIKVGRHFDRMRKLLQETGHADAIVIEHATTAKQKITQLADYPEGERPYFSIILSTNGNGGQAL